MSLGLLIGIRSGHNGKQVWRDLHRLLEHGDLILARHLLLHELSLVEGRSNLSEVLNDLAGQCLGLIFIFMFI